MAVKFTKNEMNRVQKKLLQLKKYLPTLQLKKMLLQTEVNKAKEEVDRSYRLYKEEMLTFETSVKLLSDPSVQYIEKELLVEELKVKTDNIAGIEIPSFSKVSYKESSESFQYRPLWHADMKEHLRSSKTAYIKWEIAKKKKAILDEEHRSVSIRVNLFEKRLIPTTEEDITKIKVFLGDQNLAAVSLAKLAKEKLLKRKLEQMGEIL
jgi:V/A-type H+-transporting ATPase subunit D